MEFMACATKTLHPNTDVLLTVVLVSPPYIYYIEVALVGHALACTYLNTYLGAVRHRAIAAAQHNVGQTDHLHSRVGSKAPVDWQFGSASKATPLRRWLSGPGGRWQRGPIPCPCGSTPSPKCTTLDRSQ
jgi:hypothetical protein